MSTTALPFLPFCAARCSAALLLVLALLLQGTPAPAQEHSLFQDYQYGMPRSQALERPGAYDCADLLGSGAVCVNGIRFLDRGWDLDLSFNNQGLTSVSLRTPFERSVYARAFAALDERFELVVLQSARPPLDLLHLWHSAPHSGLASRQMTEYEAQGMEERELAYVFLERTGIHHAMDEARSVSELLARADPGTRQAALVLHHDPDDRDWIVLQFDLARAP